jgi:hypothetical protein
MKLLTLCLLGSALLACANEVSKSPAPEPQLTSPAVANPAIPRRDSVAVSSALPLPDSAAIKSMPASTARPPMNWSDSIDAFEVAGIAASGGKVFRASYRDLRIRLLDGRTIAFKSDSTVLWGYRYHGYLKEIHSHVVHLVPYEDTGHYLVVDDSTGDSTTVYAVPVPSPDGTRFVLTSLGEDAESDVGNISVWRMVGRKPEKEFSIDDQGWDSSNAVWRDSVNIDFTMNTPKDPNFPFTFFETPARLTRTGSTWVLPDKRR